ncbi:MAG: hypothetical protein FJX53_05560 [Alphaproteobacteria bacterium]|nr:hypothetical protein [Alphaproteobacteria bacterium]
MVATSLRGDQGEEVARRIGYIPVVMPFAEVGPAVERGVIDCVLRIAGRP